MRRIHGVLHAALAQAQRWDWIWINPAANASPPRHVPNEIHPPTPADVALLIAKATASDPAFGTYLRLAASTGARRSQLLALRWNDVDLAVGRISFTRALVEGPKGLVLAPTKTRRAYQVSLDADTLAIVNEHRESAGGSVDAFVFSHDSDGRSPWKPNWATKEFIRLRQLPAFRTVAFTTSATSWPPRCSPPASRSPSSQRGCRTPVRPPPSTSMRMPYLAATPTPPKRSATSSAHPHENRPEPITSRRSPPETGLVRLPRDRPNRSGVRTERRIWRRLRVPLLTGHLD